MQRLKYLIRDRVVSHGLADSVNRSLMIERFQKMVERDFGKQGRGHLGVISIKGVVMNISAASSSFKQAVRLKEAEYIKELNKGAPAKIVKFTYYS